MWFLRKTRLTTTEPKPSTIYWWEKNHTMSVHSLSFHLKCLKINIMKKTVMMEHDSWDNRLFVNRNFFKYFFDTFGFESGLEARKYIADWFSNKFNLEVNYVE